MKMIRAIPVRTIKIIVSVEEEVRVTTVIMMRREETRITIMMRRTLALEIESRLPLG